MSRIASPLGVDLDIPAAERDRLLHETRGPTALAVVFTFYGLSIVLVSLRMYVRLLVSRLAWLDDWLIVLIATPMVAFVYCQVRSGDGRHLIALTEQDADDISRSNFAAVTIWVFAITATKVSILLQYIRYFQSCNTRRLAWWLMAITVAGYLSTLVVVMMTCIPLEAAWNTEARKHAKCLNQRVYWQIQSIFEAITCWAILYLPIPPLWKARLPTSQRIGLLIVLGLSSTPCIAALLRLHVAFESFPSEALEVNDFTWDGIYATVYAVTEVHLGIVCCSLPSLMPLRFRFCPCWFKSRPHHRQAQQPPMVMVGDGVVDEANLPKAIPLLPTPSVGSGAETTGAHGSVEQSKTVMGRIEHYELATSDGRHDGNQC